MYTYITKRNFNQRNRMP